MTTESKQARGRFGKGGGRGGRFGKGGGRGGRFGRGGRGGRGKTKKNSEATNHVSGEPSELKASAPEFKPGVAPPSNKQNKKASANNQDKNQKQNINNNKSDGKHGGNATTKKNNSKGGNTKKGDDNTSNNNKKKKTNNDLPNEKKENTKKQQSQQQLKGKSKNNGNKGSKGKNSKSTSGRKSSATSAAPQKPSIPPNQSQQTNDLNYARGENITVFHVGEKPSIAQAIARGLCNGDMINRKKILPVHEFKNPAFPKAPHAKKVTHKVSSVAGHVFSVDFPQQFQSWESVDPAELFTAPIVRKPCKGSIVKHLQDEARGADFIVLWMDCDREGENINFEVLDCCMHLMKGGNGVANYDRVYRAYFSAINPSDIMKAYNNLGKPDRNQALSVDARQELDLKVGVAFSRFQTRFFQGRYGDLDSSVLSYGPCQTPTLGFCVQRHIDIETFKPEPYWTLELGILKRGRMLRATWESGRSFNKNKTVELVAKVFEDNPTVMVTNVVTKDKKQGRPIPLNTVNLLKACSKALGIGPHAAMQAAERLYLSGYLSYPRTESSAYPKSFDIRGSLQQQAGDPRWGNYVKELLAQGHNKSRGGVDHGDHPPITPCRSAGFHELSGDMARIYELVVRHFIASVSHDAVWRSTKVGFSLEALGPKGNFSVSGKEIVSKGFLEVLLHKQYGDEAENDDDDEEERTMPEFAKGEAIPLLKTNTGSNSSKIQMSTTAPVWASLDVKEKQTQPPKNLSEAELIGMMEKHGIGTDASIPTHIQNIQNRNYVRLETGRRLIPNKLGLVLVQGYHQIDSGLVLPKIRSDIEDQCSRISKGEMSKEIVVEKAIAMFEQKFDFFVKNINRMDVLFGSSFSKLEDVGKAFTRCGLSRRYLQLIEGPPPRLYNKHTETVYPLPAGGIIKQWSGRQCPVEGCGFELSMYSTGAPPRSFPLCPNCFNNPDYSLAEPEENPVDKEDQAKEQQIRRMAGKALTLECPLPDNHPLVEELYVSPDPDSDGVFIIDPHFGPKWRLVSTRDATIIHLPKCIEKVTILNEKDEVLGCHKMKVEFKAGESPLESKENNYTCFFPTDPVLQSLSRVYHGSERTKATGRGGRGRGKGRGGRGRGRGSRR